MRTIAFGILCAAALMAQTVTSVSSAGAFRNTVLAPGGMFFVFGTGLGPAQTFRASPPYVTALGPYSIALRDAAGAETRAYLVALQAGGAVAIVPSSVAEGDYDLIYTAGTTRSAPVPVHVAKRSLALFTDSGDGTGLVTAVASGRDIGLTAPVRPGDQITMLATGLGATPGADDRADPRQFDVQVDLRIGGKIIPATFAGRSAAGAGLDELRFTMPDDAEVGEGCYLPVRARIDGVWSNLVTLPKANTDSVCAHPLGVSADVLRKLDFGQSLVLGNFDLIRRSTDIDIPGRQDQVKNLFALGRFFAGDENLLLNSNGRPELSGLDAGECIADTGALANSSNTTLDDLILNLATSRPVFRQATAYDGGTRAQVTTPTSYALAMQLVSTDGTLAGVIDESNAAQAAAITPGDWLAEWPGGTQLAAGKATLTLAETEPVVWNQTLGAIDASQPVPLKWSIKGLPDTTLFSVAGIFVAPGDGNTINFGTFSCLAAGQEFTVPLSVLQRMPKAESGRAFLTLVTKTARQAFSVDYRNQLGRSDYAAFSQEVNVAKVREYKR